MNASSSEHHRIHETAGDKRIGVLLTEGSSSSARQTIYALADRFRLGVLDPDRLCQARFSRHATFHRCPHFGQQPKQYLRFVSDTMRQHRYDVLFPTHDQVYLLSRFQSLFGEHIRSVLPDFESLCQLQSKVGFQAMTQEIGLPCPSTTVVRWSEQPQDPPTFPCYLKSDHGTAGAGVRLVEDQAELASALNEFQHAGLISEGSEYLIQQPCAGIHSVAQCVFDRGTLLAIHCAETLRRGVGGGQGFRIGAKHPPVVDHMRLLGRHLNWHGPLFLEYFYDSVSQRPEYIEANPRIGETLNAMFSGVNLCQLVVALATGEDIPQDLPSPRIGIRSHVDFLLLIAEAMTGARRRYLLKRLIQMVRKSGEFQGTFCEMTRPRDDWASLIPATAALARVFISPLVASNLVTKSLSNYALTDSAANAIESLTFQDVREALAAASKG